MLANIDLITFAHYKCLYSYAVDYKSTATLQIHRDNVIMLFLVRLEIYLFQSIEHSFQCVLQLSKLQKSTEKIIIKFFCIRHFF